MFMTLIWNETVDSQWTQETWSYYFSDSNLTAGLWTWEIELTDTGLTDSVYWELYIKVFYA